MGQTITVLGAGRMGSALALAFLGGGHTVTVWNRTGSRAAPLAARGIRVAPSLVDAITGANLVIGNLADYAVTDTLIRTPDTARALAQTTFVQLASGIPSHARDLATWAESHGIPLLDGAIMATPNFVGTPECTLLYAGPQALFDRHAAALAALGTSRYVGPLVGHANALDNALLVVLWGAALGTFYGAALCDAERFPIDAFGATLASVLPVVDASVLDAVSRIHTHRFDADEATAATVATCHASVKYLHAMGKEYGLDRGLTEALDRVFQRTVDRGGAGRDISAVFEAMRADQHQPGGERR